MDRHGPGNVVDQLGPGGIVERNSGGADSSNTTRRFVVWLLSLIEP